MFTHSPIGRLCLSISALALYLLELLWSYSAYRLRDLWGHSDIGHIRVCDNIDCLLLYLCGKKCKRDECGVVTEEIRLKLLTLNIQNLLISHPHKQFPRNSESIVSGQFTVQDGCGSGYML